MPTTRGTRITRWIAYGAVVAQFWTSSAEQIVVDWTLKQPSRDGQAADVVAGEAAGVSRSTQRWYGVGHHKISATPGDSLLVRSVQ